MKTIIVENDPFPRLIGVILDPETPAERIAAFADFFKHDLPDFPGWLESLRKKLPTLFPSRVILVDDEVQMRQNLGEADALVTESLPVTDAVLAAAPKLKVIHKYGSITNNIKLRNSRLPVLTIRRRANIACSEHAFAMMLGLSRKMHRVINRISNAQLEVAGYHPTQFDRRHTANSNWARVTDISILHDTTLGIVGMGEIGREVALRGVAFGMNILYHQRTLLDAETSARYSARYAAFDELLGASDWIVICLPGNTNTRHLFNTERFGQMKRGAHLINISRAEIVERNALLDALQGGILGGFALDPLYEAPGRDDDELLRFDHVLITPHLAAQPRFNALNDISDLLLSIEEKIK